MKRLQLRTVHTCMGEFVICQSGHDLWAEPMPNRDEVYPLPMPDMTNDEIKDYFRLLKEEEE